MGLELSVQSGLLTLQKLWSLKQQEGVTHFKGKSGLEHKLATYLYKQVYTVFGHWTTNTFGRWVNWETEILLSPVQFASIAHPAPNPGHSEQVNSEWIY